MSDHFNGLFAATPQPIMERKAPTYQGREDADGRTLLIVDSSVEDRDILLADLPDTIEVMQMGPSSLSQLAAKIRAAAPVENLHFLTHGEPGALRLGGNRIDAKHLKEGEPFADALTNLLGAGSKLALWACSVAAKSAGQAFTSALGALTGADVFASQQPVGATSGGGTWNIGTLSPFSGRAMAQYPHTLPAANEDFDGITAQIVSNTDHFNNDSTTDWNFIQATDAQIAIAGNANGGTFTNGLSNDGAGDRIIFLNYNGLTSNNTTFSFEQSDGDHFQLVSFELGNNLAGYSTSLTITLLRNNVTVGSATIDLNTSSASNGVTYTYGGDSSSGSARPYGTLTFNSTYGNVDEIQLVYSSAATPIIDNIVVGTPTNIVPTSTGGSVSVKEDHTKTFASSDFNYSDADSGAFTSVRIDTLPATGTLSLSGVPVTAGDVITVANIPNLTFTPNANSFTNTSFTYSVNDGIDFAASASTMSIQVQRVNDAPNDISLTDQSVQETVAGAIVGIVSGKDIDDLNSSLVFTVDDDRFIIDDDNQLRLADDEALDFETEETVTVTLTATDGHGASYDEDFTLTVLDVNEVTTFDDDDTVAGSDNNDRIHSGGGHDTVNGHNGMDSLGGGTGDDILNGGNGDDILWGWTGNDTIGGGAGDDVLYNGQGSDSVNGGTGDDTLWAGAGDDVLTGGDGMDTFIFGATSGNDQITDFDLNDDTLDLQYSGAGFTALADIEAAASDTSVDGVDGLLIDLGNGQSVFLAGLAIGDLSGMDITI